MGAIICSYSLFVLHNTERLVWIQPTILARKVRHDLRCRLDMLFCQAFWYAPNHNSATKYKMIAPTLRVLLQP